MVNKRQLRIVLKFGSNLITTNNTVLNYKVIDSLVSQIAKIFEEHEILLVTSGAVAAGLQYISSERSTKILKKHSLVQKQILASSMYIASGLQNQVIKRIINDETVGTKFLPEESNLESRKRWLVTGYASSKGEIILDKGAVKAVNKNASVLPAGVTSVNGNFDRGDIIAIKDEK